jgi:hypothetical protein
MITIKKHKKHTTPQKILKHHKDQVLQQSWNRSVPVLFLFTTYLKSDGVFNWLDHFNSGLVFMWWKITISFVHLFICEENFSFYLKWSRLVPIIGKLGNLFDFWTVVRLPFPRKSSAYKRSIPKKKSSASRKKNLLQFFLKFNDFHQKKTSDHPNTGLVRYSNSEFVSLSGMVWFSTALRISDKYVWFWNGFN